MGRREWGDEDGEKRLRRGEWGYEDEERRMWRRG